MDRSQLLHHFETLAETPKAVEKLRKVVLELAIRGRLVSQNPKDDPAIQLVERATTVLTRNRKKSYGQNNGEQEVLVFNLPGNWCWTRLEELGDTAPRNELDDKTEVGFSPMRLVTSKFGEPISFERKTWSEVRTGFTHFADGDVVVAKITPCFENGKSGVIRGAPNGFGAGTTELHVLRPVADCVLPEYVMTFLKSAHFLLNGEQHMTGSAGQKRVPWHYFAKTPFPLPPLAEQRRIVAKVEELLALCDELEARQTAAREHRARLVRSALDHLNADSPPVDFRRHADFVLHEFLRLTTIPEDVTELRQAILSLAVQGRLVPQNSTDPPVSELLKQIGTERRRLVAAKKLAASARMKIKELPTNPLPKGWVWAPFGEVTFCRDGERIPVNSDERENLAKTYDYYGASGVIDKIDRYLFDTPLLLIGEDGANLVNRSTPIAFIAEGKYWVNNHAHVLDAINRTLLEYLRIYINSINLEPYITGMAQPKVNQAQMNSIPIALPPLAEQQRIVAKVNELMRWCDALEAQLTAAQTTAAHLLDATLRELIQFQSPAVRQTTPTEEIDYQAGPVFIRRLASEFGSEMLDQSSSFWPEASHESDAGLLMCETAPAYDWLVGMTRDFKKQIETIDRKMQGRIFVAVIELSTDPITPKGDTVKRLSGDWKEFWRYRIGDFRLVYRPEPAAHRVTLWTFAARGGVYD